MFLVLVSLFALFFFVFFFFFTNFLKKKMSYVLTKDFVFSACVPVCSFFFFSAGVHFYLASCSLLTASISHFKIFSCCFSKKKVSLFIPRCNSFSVIHVRVDIETQWERDIVLVFFSPLVRVATRFLAKKPQVPFGFPYLLIELFFIGIPVARTD